MSSSGSLLVDKVYEPLQAALPAHKSRIENLTELPKNLQEYPNPPEEKVSLAMHQHAIRDTQGMLEGPPPTITRGPISQKPNLETMLEVTSTMERGSETIAIPPSKGVIHEEEHTTKEPQSFANTTEIGYEIPDYEEELANEMW